MEKTIDHRLAWLAGILDGEGYLGFGVENLDKAGQPKTYIGAKWNVSVDNTDAAMLAEVMAIGDVIGAKHKWYARCARYKNNPNAKPMGRVSFQTKDACAVVLMAVLPYLVTKKSRAELMLRAIARRREFNGPGPRGKKTWRSWLPVADAPSWDMIGEMKSMNRRGTAAVKED